MCIGISAFSLIITTLVFLEKPTPTPINQKTVQNPPFLGNISLYIGFLWTPHHPAPLQVRFFMNPQNIKVFHP